jgi:hypothetical protein
MAAFALIHCAADMGWYWHLVERELRAHGHETAALDLPCQDDTARLAEYADTVARAAGRGTAGSHDPLLIFYHHVPRTLASFPTRSPLAIARRSAAPGSWQAYSSDGNAATPGGSPATTP